MNFLSVGFLLALPLTALLCRCLPGRMRWILLLAVSGALYAAGEGWMSLVLLGEMVLTWLAAMGMERVSRPAPRRLWLGAALLGTLLPLGLLRYTGLSPVIPAGISFFTFQMLTYVLEVYRGHFPAERHPGHYALYVSFFPQLVAGPIERPADLLPQLKNPAPVSAEDARAALWLLLRGYVKKLLLADTAAVWVDQVYGAPQTAAGPAVLGATLLFALQIYCDFSGYSDIALGSARLLGVRLSLNFDHPYRAATLRDFWRRWHITLTRFLTEYIYKPLGGSRKGKARQLLSTMAVFLLSGLWHGVGWHYLVWGALHGVLLCGERLLAPGAPKHPRLRRCVTFALVCFAWVLFRAESLPDAFVLLSRLPVGWAEWLWALPGLDWLALGQLAAGLVALCLMEQSPPEDHRLREGIFALLIASCVLAYLAQTAIHPENAFIYFRF